MSCQPRTGGKVTRGSGAVLALWLAGCGTFLPGLSTDAEQAALLTERIGPAYGPESHRVTVEDGRAYVETDFTARHMVLAETMCQDIAKSTFDKDGQPIGVSDVLIRGAGDADLVGCDVPPR